MECRANPSLDNELERFLGLSKKLLGEQRDRTIPLDANLTRLRAELARIRNKAAGRDVDPTWTEFPRCQRLKALRRSHPNLNPRKRHQHLTQSQLGQACQISGSYISKFESGMQRPWPAAQEAIAAFFERPIASVFPEYHGDNHRENR